MADGLQALEHAFHLFLVLGTKHRVTHGSVLPNNLQKLAGMGYIIGLHIRGADAGPTLECALRRLSPKFTVRDPV